MGAFEDIAAERRRQIDREGWSIENDDKHTNGEMAHAAGCYALANHPHLLWVGGNEFPLLWPWHKCWWKPKDRRRDLVRAGALIVAEIERLDRSAGKSEGGKMAWSEKAIRAGHDAYWGALSQGKQSDDGIRLALDAAAAVDGNPVDIRTVTAYECGFEEGKRETAVDGDAQWNAAIEAAAQECEADEYRSPNFHSKSNEFFDGRSNAKDQITASIRSLKRG